MHTRRSNVQGTGAGRAQRVLQARLLAGLVMAAMIAVTAAPAAASSTARWDELFGDAGGTATSASPGPTPAEIAWVSVLEDTVTSGAHEVLGTKTPLQILDAADDLVLVRANEDGPIGAQRSRLFALRASDGQVAWTLPDVDNACTPAIHGDEAWAMRRVDDDFQLISVDAAGEVTVRFTYVADDGVASLWGPCERALRFLSDGTVVFQTRSPGIAEEGVFLHAVEQDGTERFRVQVDTQYGTARPLDLRIGPAGSPAEDVIYLFDRDQGTEFGAADDVITLEARSPLDGAVQSTLVVPGSDWRASAIVVASDGALLAGTVQDDADDMPGIDDDVVGWFVRIDHLPPADPTITYARPTARTSGPTDGLRDRLSFLALADGDTLVATYGGPNDGAVGIRAADGGKVWEITEGIIANPLVADTTGAAYLNESFRSGIISVGGRGNVRWTVPTSGAQAGPLATLQAFRLQAVGPDRRVYLTAEERGTNNLAVVALGQAVDDVRPAGTGRIETAVEVSQMAFPMGGVTRAAVVARADEYADALSGAPLAYQMGGPLLLSTSDRLSPATADELRRLGVTQVVVLGGAAALSQAVEDDLRGLGIPTVRRIAGAGRFETAGMVADEVGGDRAVIVEGANADPGRGWPDAVAASAYAASTGQPIILVVRDALPDASRAALDRLGVTEATVVGGAAAVSDAVLADVRSQTGAATRLSGPTRYATSVEVANRHLAEGGSLDWLWLATGTGFADALTAGPAAAASGGVLLLVDGANVVGGGESREWIAAQRDDVGRVVVVGGPSAISEDVAAAIRAALGR